MLAGCDGNDEPTQCTCDETSRSTEKLRATAQAIKEQAPKLSEFAGGARFWESEIDAACSAELRADDKPYAHFIEAD